jgi:hypothetical protein
MLIYSAYKAYNYIKKKDWTLQSCISAPSGRDRKTSGPGLLRHILPNPKHKKASLKCPRFHQHGEM